jgi:hypothetical protein
VRERFRIRVVSGRSFPLGEGSYLFCTPFSIYLLHERFRFISCMSGFDEFTATHAELAEWTGLSVRGVTEAGKRGVMVKAGRHWNLKLSVQRYVADLQRQLRQAGGAGVASAAAAERARLAPARPRRVDRGSVLLVKGPGQGGFTLDGHAGKTVIHGSPS